MSAFGDYLDAAGPDALQGGAEDATDAQAGNRFVFGADAQSEATPGIVMPIADCETLDRKQDALQVATVASSAEAADKPTRKRTASGLLACLHPDCPKKAQHKGLCKAHGGVRQCSFPGCAKRSLTRDRCFAHGGGRRCRYKNCPRQSASKGFCSSHSKAQLLL